MKNTHYYQGKYLQGRLTDGEAQSVLQLVEDYDEVTGLKRCIYNLPSYLIHDIIKTAEAYEKENGTLEGYKPPEISNFDLGELRKEQTVGVAFLYYAKSALLGDEVGLGKTVQVAGLANVLNQEKRAQGRPFRYLFLTKKSVTTQIREKLIQFTGEYVMLLSSGVQKEVDRFTNLLSTLPEDQSLGVVGSHSLLESPQFLTAVAKQPFDLIVYDESSTLKNASSGVYPNARTLFGLHDRVVLLNATPVETNIREMYNQLDLLDPDYMPTVGEFNRMFTKTKRGMFGWEPDGFKNEDIFKDSIKLRYLARTRIELGAKYDGNKYKTILIPYSQVQKEYKKKTNMKQMLNDYPPGIYKRIEFNTETTPKLAALDYIIDREIEPGVTQALIYCRYTKAQDAIKEFLELQGYTVCILNGKIKKKADRDKLSDDYTAGLYDIMITNVLEGLDLGTCDVCILYTIDPNPQKMVQFEGRMTREFNVENKSVYLLVQEGSEKKFVETELKLRVEQSAAFAKNGNSMVLTAITQEDNKELFVQENNKSK